MSTLLKKSAGWIFQSVKRAFLPAKRPTGKSIPNAGGLFQRAVRGTSGHFTHDLGELLRAESPKHATAEVVPLVYSENQSRCGGFVRCI